MQWRILHLSAWGRTADQKKTGKTREIGAIATASEDFAAAGEERVKDEL
jgi:hypothetical protein